MPRFVQRLKSYLRQKAIGALASVVDAGRWTTLFVRESFTGAFQADVTINEETVSAQATVFACRTLIASDVAKCGVRIMQRAESGIWDEVSVPAFSPVLRKPNRFQTWQRFIESWVHSLLGFGNAFILKQRDQRKVVVAMYVLDPQRVETLVAENGDVYYRLQSDTLSGLPEDAGGLVVPADEIIHDRINCLFHPLVGLSPIFACGLAATQALKIQTNSAKFFENMSRPGGVLTAPAHIGDDTAARLKTYFEENFQGKNVGRIAVLGDGLTFEAMAVNPVDAQIVDQLKLANSQICATFHVPAYLVGAEAPPAFNNIGALYQQYYSQCLQALFESIEANLDEGLGLPYVQGKTMRVEFDLDDLMRLDPATKMDVLVKSVAGTIHAPNEARRRLNLPPVEGGDTVYLQQQNYSLEALNKRDTGENPFGKATAPAAPAPAPDPAAAAKAATDALLLAVYRKSAEDFSHV